MTETEILRAEMILEEFHKNDLPLTSEQSALVDRYHDHMSIMSQEQDHLTFENLGKALGK